MVAACWWQTVGCTFNILAKILAISVSDDRTNNICMTNSIKDQPYERNQTTHAAEGRCEEGGVRSSNHASNASTRVKGLRTYGEG